MTIKISINTRDKAAYAEGLYSENKTIVFAGGKIRAAFYGVAKIAALRNDRSVVDEQGVILKDCEFKTPSEAAQFVNGNISNGYRAWRVDGVKLGDYLKTHGMK